ncbi:O-methyltransferase [Maribacter sp. 2307ULW6-5]|uniref:O-methyltransferase n=1 Tax=Maribacter sp. 2307ULW6-5 TaxID=3386275 RepID=UPI0039BD4AC2
MKDTSTVKKDGTGREPLHYPYLEEKSREVGFTMPSDVEVCSLLRTLVASKPQGNFLEMGTGMGLSLSWMVEGMDADGTMTSLDNDPERCALVGKVFREDHRLTIVCADGGQWLRTYDGQEFDLIFADAWPGKYSEIEKILNWVRLGGFYVVDDMKPQPNWPRGHGKNVEGLTSYLEGREDFTLTRMDWSTGLVLAVRTKKGSGATA